MKQVKSFLSELFEFSMRFPLSALSGIFIVLGIIGLFCNWALALGGFSFAVVVFFVQIAVNKSL